MSAPARRASGPVAPHRPTFWQRVAARLIHLVVQGDALTQRWRTIDPHGTLSVARSRPSIFAIWHNRLAFSLVIHHRYLRRPDRGRRLAAMVSASRDGAMLAAVLEAFDVEPVRGSSSRRGPQALLELKSWADAGLDLAITPDGPRGPRYEVQPGVIALARLTGFPIVPVAYRVPWKIRLGSWDRFQIPLPLGLCEVEFAEILQVTGDSPEELEAHRVELQRRLVSVTRD